MLEGVVRGQTGLFPAYCVQEVRLRNPDGHKSGGIVTQHPTASPQQRVVGRREQQQQQQLQVYNGMPKVKVAPG